MELILDKKITMHVPHQDLQSKSRVHLSDFCTRFVKCRDFLAALDTYFTSLVSFAFSYFDALLKSAQRIRSVVTQILLRHGSTLFPFRCNIPNPSCTSAFDESDSIIQSSDSDGRCIGETVLKTKRKAETCRKKGILEAKRWREGERGARRQLAS